MKNVTWNYTRNTRLRCRICALSFGLSWVSVDPASAWGNHGTVSCRVQHQPSPRRSNTLQERRHPAHQHQPPQWEEVLVTGPEAPFLRGAAGLLNERVPTSLCFLHIITHHFTAATTRSRTVTHISVSCLLPEETHKIYVLVCRWSLESDGPQLTANWD